MVHDISELKEEFFDQLDQDPLFEVIESKGWIDELLTDEFITDLSEQNWFSTVELANIIGVGDGTLRYYVKNPFSDYLAAENSPSTKSAYRLNRLAGVKLKMMMMLKKEYKREGLLRLIGLEGYVVQSPQTQSVSREMVNANSMEDLAKKVQNLELVMKSIIETGIFGEEEVENGGKRLVVNQNSLTDPVMKLLGVNDAEGLKTKMEGIIRENGQLKENQEKMMDDYKKLQHFLNENRENNRDKKDILKKIEHNRIEVAVRERLKSEGEMKWEEQNKAGVMAYLFRRKDLAVQKKEFTDKYVAERFETDFSEEIEKYDYAAVENLTTDPPVQMVNQPSTVSK
jgi:hypothetical protein